MQGPDEPENADSTGLPQCQCLLDRHSGTGQCCPSRLSEKLIWTRVISEFTRSWAECGCLAIISLPNDFNDRKDALTWRFPGNLLGCRFASMIEERTADGSSFSYALPREPSRRTLLVRLRCYLKDKPSIQHRCSLTSLGGLLQYKPSFSFFRP